MNHTPGPWLALRDEYEYVVVVFEANEEGRKYVPLAEGIENEGDAVLIAAAPDLVELCNDLLIHGADAEPIRQKAWKVLRRIYGKEEE